MKRLVSTLVLATVLGAGGNGGYRKGDCLGTPPGGGGEEEPPGDGGGDPPQNV